MHRFWPHIIEPLLDALDARTIVEIGIGTGKHTEYLLPYLQKKGGLLHAIDPSPDVDPHRWHDPYTQTLRFHRALSVDALRTIPGADAVLIDGDHNWYTVTEELKIISTWSHFPCIVFHDTEWPYGRRDQYGAIERIPEEYRQRAAYGGLFPSDLRQVPGGWNPHMLHAEREGGQRNGVRTAIEDFIAAQTRDVHAVALPGLHGLFILLPKETVTCHPACALLLTELEHPLLRAHCEAIERDRIEQMIEKSALQRSYDNASTNLHALARILELHTEEHRLTDPASAPTTPPASSPISLQPTPASGTAIPPVPAHGMELRRGPTPDNSQMEHSDYSARGCSL